MHKLYITMALLMSLVLGTGFAMSGSLAFAQSYNDQSYDDSRYSSDSYSKYPTQDNKYVCQRGPFEGFYVSSVEFCKFDFDDKKFDDKKDRHDDHDRNNRINLNTYVVTESNDVAAGSILEATATCNPGDQVLGGGFEFDLPTGVATGLIATSSEPFPEIDTVPPTNEGWEAQLSNIPTGTTGIELTAFAVCLEQT